MNFQVDAASLARTLLGQQLVHVVDGTRRSGIIVETEAYLGPEDRAAHTFGGRRTPRVASMYLEGGHAYVYFVYGMHYLFNVVAGKADEGTAVLIRALEPTEGLEEMRRARPRARTDVQLTSGPARLTQALGIDRRHDGADLRSTGNLRVEEIRRRGLVRSMVGQGPRIGVDYAGACAGWPLRFWIRGNRFVSGPRVTH